jgi:3-methylfumaryl-CoA hydratase
VARLVRFSFRAVSPLFDIAPFTVNGAPGEASELRLWAANAGGGLAMSATATLNG